MADKRKETPDLNKVPPYPHASWLAGFLEAGASMRLTILRNFQNGHVTPQARPEIVYGDTDPARISLLKILLGGNYNPKPAKPTQYAVVRGEKAALLAHSIGPYAPSRQTMVSAFLDWLHAQFTEDRVALAESMAGRRVVDPVTAGVYTRLVKNEDFVGGVIDCRGRIIPIEQPDSQRLTYWLTNRIKVNSVNGPLLSALQGEHGGQFVQVGKEGDTVVIRGTQTKLKNNLFEWILAAKDTKTLLDWAKPKLPLSNASNPPVPK